jgi:S1-C subfamily serine protease
VTRPSPPLRREGSLRGFGDALWVRVASRVVRICLSAPGFVAAAVLLAGFCCAASGSLAQKPPPLGSPEPAGKPPPPASPPSGGSGSATAGGPGTGAKPPPLAPGGGPFGRPPEGGEGGGGRDGRRATSSGTGFVVGAGRILTNHHVAQGCAEMRVRTAGGRELTGTVAASDPERDLALLAVQGGSGLGPPLPFRSGPELRRGEGVVTYGFPLAGLLSSGPTLTTGEVSALAGLRDNPRQFQISAPVQPGNSGGPLLDRSGNVVGIVVSKLNAQRVARSTGDIPQNVNFAVKGTEALDFLRRNGVQPRLAHSAGTARGADEVGEVAHPSTVFLRCMR